MSNLGRMLIIFGLILLVMGLLISYGGNIPIINKLGKLPGDFVIKREGFVLYFPLATSLILSAIVYLLFKVFQR
ncbi:MAG: DUF2905 domain-containing protein [Candidatus Marinimicrobia bacterium]|nr:DUF2905 domain-containing protein [Candidatus Neomarinimicrobiota bacterium]